MSTTAELDIALKYSQGKSGHAVLLWLHSKNFMDRGVDLKWLSAFPHEAEYLYPPLSYLKPTREEPTVDLVKIPGERRRLASVHLRASLQEAWDTLREQEVEALVVERPTHKSQITVYGVLTREAVDGAYRT